MTIINSTFSRSVAIALAASSCCLAQSVLGTVLGASPDGIDALSATLNTPNAVVGDSNGNVYAALKGTHQVVRIDPAGSVWVVAGNGALGSAGDGGPAKSAALSVVASLAIDSTGNLYICDSSAQRIRRVATDGTISTFAGNGKTGNTGDGGPATQATLKSPTAIAFDGSGNLLIADTDNQVIRMVAVDGTISRIAGTGLKGADGNDGPALSATLNSPSGIAVDSAQNIYISDTANNWIRKISPDGTISRYAGRDLTAYNGGGFGNAGDPNVATNAVLSTPTSLAVDQAGNVFVLEYGAIKIRRITTAGKIANYAGTGTGGGAGDGGLAKSANINAMGIAIDRHNNLLIADGVSHKVRIVTAADGIIETLGGNGLATYNPRGFAVVGDLLYFSDSSSNRVRTYNLSTKELGIVAGTGQASFSGDDDYATKAALNAPRGLAFDSAGMMYIADSGNNRIRRIDLDGVITTIAGTGAATSIGDWGPATAATLHEPDALVIDASDSIYVAERLGHAVRLITADGTITTVAGIAGSGGAPTSETGVATEQKLNGPQGLALETAGTLLIADASNNRVRRLNLDGTISTVAGTGTSGFSGDGGPATSARLSNPTGVSVDAAGNIYIADTSGNAVRRVDSDGNIATVAGLLKASGTPSGGYNGDGSPATAYSLSGPTFLAVGPSCSMLIADTSNSRIRQLWPAVDYSLTTDPAHLQVTVDGQAVTTPATVSLLPGTTHRIDAASPQDGSSGTRYIKTSDAQDVKVACGPTRADLSLSFQTQYSLTVTAGDGGTVSGGSGWLTAGTAVTLTASPAAGYTFTGWTGACSGVAACQLTMDGPKTVNAAFAPAN